MTPPQDPEAPKSSKSKIKLIFNLSPNLWPSPPCGTQLLTLLLTPPHRPTRVLTDPFLFHPPDIPFRSAVDSDSRALLLSTPKSGPCSPQSAAVTPSALSRAPLSHCSFRLPAPPQHYHSRTPQLCQPLPQNPSLAVTRQGS